MNMMTELATAYPGLMGAGVALQQAFGQEA